jgi:Uma2 family endonuclease
MAVDVRATDDLKLVRAVDGLEIDLGPLQGLWTEEQYLALTDSTNWLMEFTDGMIEVLPMPTDNHQVILLYLYRALYGFIQPRGGTVLVAPLRLHIRARKYREPDILLVRDARDSRRRNRFWYGADLVVEIVSADDERNRERDIGVKPADYAEAGVPEYWIVDPEAGQITVLTLAGATYAEHGRFQRGAQATSVLLAGFAVDVNAVLDAE